MKSNLDKFFKTDEKMESEGIWFEVSEGVAFRIKRFGGENSPKVKAAYAKYYKPFASQIDKGSISEEKEKAISIRVFVESCIVDWRGVELDGAIAPFSTETAFKFLFQLPDLHDVLLKHATESVNFRVDLGNS